MIHASVQTRWMWGHNYSLQSNLQQLVCLSPLVAQVPPSVCIWVESLGALRSVWCGITDTRYSSQSFGSGCGEADRPNVSAISAVAHGKVAEVPSVRDFVV